VIERREAGLAGTAARTLLPASVRIEEVRLSSSARSFDDVAVDYSPLGLSSTWAVKLVAEERSLWLVFAGLSGQMTVLEDDAQAAQYLSP
jgi:hypothetical protein